MPGNAIKESDKIGPTEKSELRRYQYPEQVGQQLLSPLQQTGIQ